jgi:hypothetical protein
MSIRERQRAAAAAIVADAIQNPPTHLITTGRIVHLAVTLHKVVQFQQTLFVLICSQYIPKPTLFTDILYALDALKVIA